MKSPQVKRNAQAAWQAVEDNIVVVTPQTKKIHILSGAGGKIWQLLETPQEQSVLVKEVVDEYEVDIQQAEKDIEAFIQELIEKDIVCLKTEG